MMKHVDVYGPSNGHPSLLSSFKGENVTVAFDRRGVPGMLTVSKGEYQRPGGPLFITEAHFAPGQWSWVSKTQEVPAESREGG